MPDRYLHQHNKVSFTTGAALLLSLLTAVVSGSIIFAMSYAQPAARPGATAQPVGNIGTLTQEAIEAKYGTVNKAALHEVKEGLFANIRARRQGCQPCVPQQQQAWCSQASSCYGTFRAQQYSFTTPCVPAVAITPATPAPQPTTTQPVVPPQFTPASPLKIKPSCEGSDCQMYIFALNIKPSN